MKMIFRILWSLIKLLAQTDKQPAAAGTPGLGLICSFEAYVPDKSVLRPLPPRKAPAPQAASFAQTAPKRQASAPNTDWKVWCDNNRMLFKTSA
jgi:hypothetical protein